MKKIFLLLAALTVCAAAWAVPAMPGYRTYQQADGSSIDLQLVGDEYNHSFVTRDGLTVERGLDGAFYYITASGLSKVMAHNQDDRSGDELSWVSANRGNLNLAALMTPQKKQRVKAAMAAQKTVAFTPTSGTPKFPVLLANFSDVSFTHSAAEIQEALLSGAKSVSQYFSDMSGGQYVPQFDVYGVYTLPNNRKYYGGSNAAGTDERPGTMTKDVLNLATDVDFTQYDNDNDGYVDAVIVIYAGVGQAQSALAEAVWPLQALMSETYGSYSIDGKRVERFAVFNELNLDGSTGQIDGIGTFCHEFSHTLGLADYYPTATYQYGVDPYGMGTWSLMDMGCYNDNTYTPIGYGAYEKSFLGWMSLTEPVPNTKYTLPVFNAGNDRAVKVTYDGGGNGNEYIVLEYRAKQGWDAFIKDEGVLATHVTYYKAYFDANEVNVYGDAQMMTIFPADNDASDNTETTDLYGETNHELTDSSSPAAIGIWGGTNGYFGKPITEINLNSNGTASFWYIKGEQTGNEDINDDGSWSMADVTTLIAYVLGNNPSPCLEANCDVNGDGNVSMADVTTLIAQILGN